MKALGALLLVSVVAVALGRFHIPSQLDVLPNNGTNWAVLVAGSSEWENYRHQSDVCHAYQILHKNGIPDSNIIVMMYDDIADSIHNKYKGQIFNEIGGPDVYHNVPKDYTKHDVNPKTFLSVLAGTPPGVGSNRVLNSGPNDRVFIYFSDHGASGMICFPMTLGIINHYVYADELVDALKDMAAKNRFHQLVFYLESCESGSMFNKLLPNNLNIYATSAATPFESSWACTYDNELGTWLDDCYSINWMNDTDYANIHTETLQQQYETIHTLTNESTVCQYGDVSIAAQPLSNFIAQNSFEHSGAGHSSHNVHDSEHHESHHRRHANKHARKHATGTLDPVSSRDVRLAMLQRQAAAEQEPQRSMELHAAVAKEKASRAAADRAIRNVVRRALHSTTAGSVDKYVAASLAVPAASDTCTSRAAINFPCLRAAVTAYEKSCGVLSDYGLQHVRVLERLCGELAHQDQVIAAAAAACA